MAALPCVLFFIPQSNAGTPSFDADEGEYQLCRCSPLLGFNTKQGLLGCRGAILLVNDSHFKKSETCLHLSGAGDVGGLAD